VLGVGARHARTTHDDGGAQHAGSDGHDQRGADFADRHHAEGEPARQGADGHQEVRPAQQPAVPQPDFSTASGEPEEEQTPRGPLQQNGGRVETNHCRKANDVPMKQESDGSQRRLDQDQRHRQALTNRSSSSSHEQPRIITGRTMTFRRLALRTTGVVLVTAATVSLLITAVQVGS
jgi:hypothetical protein